jgi:hypothetical protein
MTVVEGINEPHKQHVVSLKVLLQQLLNGVSQN